MTSHPLRMALSHVFVSSCQSKKTNCRFFSSVELYQRHPLNMPTLNTKKWVACMNKLNYLSLGINSLGISLGLKLHSSSYLFKLYSTLLIDNCIE